jgi:hypothetical protein
VPEGPAAVRSIVAVGAGFFAIQMLSLGGDSVFRAVAPAGFDAQGHAIESSTFLISLIYVAVFECLGGYITARLALVKPLPHTLWLGILILALNLIYGVLTWGEAPEWYQIASVLIIVPMTLLGGKIREVQARASAS